METETETGLSWPNKARSTLFSFWERLGGGGGSILESLFGCVSVWASSGRYHLNHLAFCNESLKIFFTGGEVRKTKSGAVLLAVHAVCVVLHPQVAKPRVGENHPAQVRADVAINLSVRPEVKYEWEGGYSLLLLGLGIYVH